MSILSSIDSRMRNIFPSINRGTYLISLCSAVFYFFALYPSRNHWDTVEILKLARNGKSSDQWTAIYFRFLEFLSIGGVNASVPAFFGLVGLILAFMFFVSSFKLTANRINLVTRLFLLTPFIGIFGMTLTHEVQSTTGSLLLLGILVRKQNFDNQGFVESRALILLGCLLLSMVHIGIFIFLGFAMSYLIVSGRNLLFLFLTCSAMAIMTLFGHQLFKVEVQSEALRYQSFLGDIKCITQHPDSVISEEDWAVLLKSGTKTEWTDKSTCAYSQVYFAFPWVEKNQKDTLKLWLKLTAQNPQLSLEARLQRSANVLPPFLFVAPQQSMKVNALEPVGLNTQDDLLVWSPLFKTSNDDPYQKMNLNKPKFIDYMEAVVILPGHLLNRNSAVWGWAGLWLTLAALLLYLVGPYRIKEIFIILSPLVFTCVSLFLFSPISDPRYSMNITIPSIGASLLYFPELFQKIRQHK